MPSRRLSGVVTLFALGLICMSVRIAVWATWSPTSEVDTPSYVDMAYILRSLDFSHYLGLRPPGYPLLLLLAALDFDRVWVLQSILGVAISLMVYSLTYSQTRSAAWAFLAGLAHSLNLNQLLFEASILTETFSAFLLVAVVWLLLRPLGAGGQRLSVYVAAGVAAGIASLTRPLLLYLGPLCLLVLFHDWRRVRVPLPSRLKWALFFLAPWILLVVGWSLFNLVTVDYFGVTTLGGYEITNQTGAFIELAPEKYAAVKEVYLRYRAQRMAQFGTHVNTIHVAVHDLLKETGLSYSDLSRTLLRMSLELIAAHPIRYLKGVTRAWVDFWRQNIYWQANPRPGLQLRIWSLQWWLIQGAVLIFLAVSSKALWSLVRGRRNPPVSIQCLLPTSIVLVGSVIQALIELGGNARYAIPFQPLVVLVAFVSMHSASRRASTEPLDAGVESDETVDIEEA